MSPWLVESGRRPKTTFGCFSLRWWSFSDRTSALSANCPFTPSKSILQLAS